MNYIVIGTDKNFISPQLLGLNIFPDITILQAEDIITAFLPTDKIFIQSESALSSILPHMVDTTTADAIHMLNNKVEARTLLHAMYPDFHYKKIPLDKIDTLQLEQGKTYVLKPTRGFHGVGVKIITNKTNLNDVKQDISKEIKKNIKLFSPTMFSQDNFILEEFIEGEEYAVDMYYNKTGQPVIINIYHHPIPEDPAYLNALYYTSHETFSTLYTPIIQFFTKLNTVLNVQGFAIHAEFKYHDGKLFPIELNPLRYGGSGLADLTYYAFQFNPYHAFFTDMQPNWEKFWQTNKHKYFGWINAYNGKNINTKLYIPDHESFKHSLGKILQYYHRNYLHEPVFSCAYVEHTNKEKLYKILHLDFSNFFVKR